MKRAQYSLFALLISLGMISPSFSETLTVSCGSSDGYSYYFEGGLVQSEKAGFTDDSIKDGKYSLTLKDDGSGDVLFIDATGDLSSATAQGARVIVMPFETGSANWLVLYDDGTLEVYSFSGVSQTLLSYRNTVGNDLIAKNSLMKSTCTIR